MDEGELVHAPRDFIDLHLAAANVDNALPERVSAPSGTYRPAPTLELGVVAGIAVGAALAALVLLLPASFFQAAETVRQTDLRLEIALLAAFVALAFAGGACWIVARNRRRLRRTARWLGRAPFVIAAPLAATALALVAHALR